jgi:excisionase family DNA binding protein
MIETIDEPLWDPKDVAAYLRISRAWVYAAAADGRLPCRRIGALLRFLPADIRTYVEAGATRPAVRSLKPTRRTPSK